MINFFRLVLAGMVLAMAGLDLGRDDDAFRYPWSRSEGSRSAGAYRRRCACTRRPIWD